MQVISKSVLVEPEFVDTSKLCKRIVNTISGFADRKEVHTPHEWSMLFKWAKQNPDQFEVEMMSDITSPVDEEGNIIWLESELQAKPFPELKKIGTGLSVTARDKETLVKRILAKQAGKSEEE